jgi:hypothetical protein
MLHILCCKEVAIRGVGARMGEKIRELLAYDRISKVIDAAYPLLQGGGHQGCGGQDGGEDQGAPCIRQDHKGNRCSFFFFFCQGRQ